jgi:peptidoglycan/LPS O-acetylase OafA/YrhL
VNAILGSATLAALVVTTAGVLALCPALAAKVLGDDPPERVAPLDGMRAFLALAVFLHHGIVTHRYFGGTPWESPPGNFDSLCGQAAVALFFMISAYLFWGRVLRSHGRLDWIEFFRGRVRRIAPMYYVSVLLFFAVVAAETEFQLRVPADQLIAQALRWMAFAFLGLPEINGLNGNTILGQIWTLKFEWVFYAALPLLAWTFLRIGRAWPIYLAMFAPSLSGGGAASMIAYFATGCFAAHLAREVKPDTASRVLWSAGGILALLTLGYFFHDVFGPLQALLLFPVFVAALQASGPWTVMRWRPVRFLGHISFSIYLLHLALIHIFVGGTVGFSRFGSLPDVWVYPAAYLMGIGVIAISVATFLAIEKPFLSRRARPLKNASEPLAAAAVAEAARE